MPALREPFLPRGFSVEPAPRPCETPDLAPRGRVCAQGGCATVLSVYNPNETCWLCTDDLNRVANDAVFEQARRRNEREERAEFARRHRAAGWSLERIAIRLGIPSSTVRNYTAGVGR